MSQIQIHKSLVPFKTDFTESSAEIPRRDHLIIHTNNRLNANGFSEFDRFQFQEHILLTGNQNLTFNGCVFRNGIDLSQFRASVVFIGCFFQGDINTYDERSDYNLTLEKCDLDKRGYLFVKYGGINILNTSFDTIKIASNCRSLKISGEKTEIKLIDISGVSPNFKFIVNDKSLIRQLLCHLSHQLISIDLNNCTINDLLIVGQVQRLNFNEVESRIANISTQTGNKVFDIKNSNLDILKIKDSHFEKARITQSRIKELKFSKIGSGGEIEISKLKSLKDLVFYKVKSDKIDLSEVRIERLCIRKTNFTNWEIGYIDWSKKFTLFLDEADIFGKDKYLELLETSRKLKKYFKADENIIDAEVFRVAELSSYFNYLWRKILEFDLSWSQFVDFLVLGSNKLFSRFGSDPVRPLFFLFSIHFLLVFGLLRNNNIGLDICFQTINCAYSPELLAFYFNTLNPIHKLIDSAGDAIYSSVDFLMRVSSGYFIYYFIQATRKFGRR